MIPAPQIFKIASVIAEEPELVINVPMPPSTNRLIFSPNKSHVGFVNLV